MRVGGDNGSIVLGWLTKLVILFALLGLLAFDAIQVVVSNFGAADDATTAASAAADAYRQSKSLQQAYNAATAAVAGKGDTIETSTFSVAPDGSVQLTVDRLPTTLWMHRIGWFDKLIHVHQQGSASAAP